MAAARAGEWCRTPTMNGSRLAQRASVASLTTSSGAAASVSASAITPRSPSAAPTAFATFDRPTRRGASPTASQ